MTLQDLKNLRALKFEIREQQNRLEHLERIVLSPTSSRITGMPRGSPDPTDSRIQRMICDISDLRVLIIEQQARRAREQAEAERWIAELPDSFTRNVIRWRFVDGLNWKAVYRKARQIKDNTSVESVKKLCYRLFDEKN